MLVDDDEATNFLHKMVLKKSGICDEIHTALNGKEALDYVLAKGKYESRTKPNIIFLDINMPVMDGWEFIESFKSLDDNIKKDIMIAMLTTSFNPDDRIKAEAIPEITIIRNKPLSYDAIAEIEKIYTDLP